MKGKILTSSTCIFSVHCPNAVEILWSTASQVPGANNGICKVRKTEDGQENSDEGSQEFHLEFVNWFFILLTSVALDQVELMPSIILSSEFILARVFLKTVFTVCRSHESSRE